MKLWIEEAQYPYVGLNSLSATCCLRIYHTGKDVPSHIVVMTELDDNKGPSVTNSVELVATKVAGEFKLMPATTRWVEHYPNSPGRLMRPASFDEVTFNVTNGNGTYDFRSPQWRHMSGREHEAFADLLGEDLAERQAEASLQTTKCVPLQHIQECFEQMAKRMNNYENRRYFGSEAKSITDEAFDQLLSQIRGKALDVDKR